MPITLLFLMLPSTRSDASATHQHPRKPARSTWHQLNAGTLTVRFDWGKHCLSLSLACACSCLRRPTASGGSSCDCSSSTRRSVASTSRPSAT